MGGMILRHLRTILGIALLLLPGCGRTTPGISLSETSFDTDAERAGFVSEVSRVRLPATATDFDIQYTEWLGWWLYASFALSGDDFKEFRDHVRQDADMAGDAFQGAKEADAETFKAVFPESGLIWGCERNADGTETESWSSCDRQQADSHLQTGRQRGRLVGEAFRLCDEDRQIDTMLIFINDTRRVRIRSTDFCEIPRTMKPPVSSESSSGH